DPTNPSTSGSTTPNSSDSPDTGPGPFVVSGSPNLRPAVPDLSSFVSSLAPTSKSAFTVPSFTPPSTSTSTSTSSSTTRTAKPGEVVSTGGALLSQQVTDAFDQFRSGLAALKPAPAETAQPDTAQHVTGEPEASMPAAEDVALPKRSSTWAGLGPGGITTNQWSAPPSTIEARTVHSATDSPGTVVPLADVGSALTTFTNEPTAVDTKSSAVTVQDAPEVMTAAPEATTTQPTNLLAHVM